MIVSPVYICADYNVDDTH